MVSFSGEAPRRGSSNWLIAVLGYAISAASLLWVYWGFDWRTELPKLATADWRWVTLAMVADVATYFLQGWRWSLLLRPVAPAKYLRSVQAIFVGLFANSVLPFRSGEIIRSYLQTRWVERPFPVVVTSVVIERLLDGILLITGFYITTMFVPVPGYLRDGSLVLGVFVGILSLLLGIVMFHKHRAHAAISKSRWAEMLWHVVEGLHAMGNARSFIASAAVSFAYLLSQLVPVYAVARGINLDLPLQQVIVVLVIMRIGTVLPQAPSNVGGFQFFSVVALQLFGIEKGVAAGFATILFLVMNVPLWLGGAVACALTGIGIHDLQHHARAGFAPSIPAGDV
jgi:uncharacterized protein (TIRG00374 family)